MIEIAKPWAQRAQSLVPEPGCGAALLVKFFEKVSGDTFVMRFGKTQPQKPAGEARWSSHGQILCRSSPSSMTERAFCDRLTALRPRGSTRKKRFERPPRSAVGSANQEAT